MTREKTNLQYEKNGILVMSLTMLANLLNYVFQITMGNMMSVEEYGTLNVLLSYYAMLSMMISLFQTFTARYVALYHAKGEEGRAKAFMLRMFSLGGCAAAILLAAGLGTAPFWARILQIEGSAYIRYLYVCGAVNIFAMIFWGAFQGCEKFISYSLSNDCASAVKLVLAVVLLQAGLGVAGVLASIIISTLTVSIWGSAVFGRYRRIRPERDAGIRLQEVKGYLTQTVIIQFLVGFLTNCDILLVKAFIRDEEVTGLYSAGMTLGKIPLYVATTLAAVLLPAVVGAGVKKKDTKVYLVKALGYSTGIAVLYSVCLNVFGRLIVRILYGERYLSATELFLPINLFVFTIILLTILMNYFIACAQTRVFSVTVVLGSIVIAAGVFFRHEDVADILYFISFVLFLTALTNLWMVFIKKETVTI